jgi:hypothetical protein
VDIPQIDPKLYALIIASTIIFILDYVFGWLSFITGPISILFVIGLLIGLISGDVVDAVLVTVTSLALGVGICALITPFVFGPVVTSTPEIMSYPSYVFYAAVYATRGPFFFLTGIPLEGEAFIVYFFVAPLHYIFSPGFSAIGAKISERLRNKMTANDLGTQTVVTEVIEQEEIVRGADSTN